MRHILILTLFLLPVPGLGDERMADVAGFVNAVWLAEEFNEHCPQSAIEISVSEVELRELLILVDGGNLVDKVAREPTRPDVNYRDDVKDRARRSIIEGCYSETALMLRAWVIEKLSVPDLVRERQESRDAL